MVSFIFIHLVNINILDILHIVGRPFEEIEIKPEWGFQLIQTEDTFLFGIQTPTGLLSVPQYLMISAFIKVLKIRAQLYLETPISKIFIQTPFKLTESQEMLFRIAASKLELEIISFVVDRNIVQ